MVSFKNIRNRPSVFTVSDMNILCKYIRDFGKDLRSRTLRSSISELRWSQKAFLGSLTCSVSQFGRCACFQGSTALHRHLRQKRLYFCKNPGNQRIYETNFLIFLFVTVFIDSSFYTTCQGYKTLSSHTCTCRYRYSTERDHNYDRPLKTVDRRHRLRHLRYYHPNVVIKI